MKVLGHAIAHDARRFEPGEGAASKVLAFVRSIPFRVVRRTRKTVLFFRPGIVERARTKFLDRRIFRARNPRLRPLAITAARHFGLIDHLKERNLDYMRGHAKRMHLDIVSYPKLIHVELSTACNIRCRMCSITRPGRNRKIQFIDPEVIERLRPVLPFIRDCKLHGGGEPFLNPHIERILEIFRKYGVRLNTVTNATKIDERLGKLIGETFSSLTVSVDGATPETFEHVRIGAKLARVEQSLDIINRYRSPDFKLIVGVVLMRCNIHELPDLVRFAARHRAQELHAAWMVGFHDLPWTHDQDPSRDGEQTNRYLVEARAVGEELGIELRLPPDVPVDESQKGKNVDQAHATPRYHDLHGTNRVEGHCRLMYDRAMVLVDGRIKPCGQSETVEGLGSVLDKSFEEIWHGPVYRRLRETFNNGTLPKTCRSCNFIRSGQLGGAKLVFDV